MDDPLALRPLQRRAAAGELAAMTELGSLLLSGRAGRLAPQEGADWLERAAAGGDAQACTHLAVLAGAGVCQPASWDRALQWLRRAASLGGESARRQLELLAAWTAAPRRQVLSETPRIRRLEGFAPEGVCDWLIERARGKLARARTYDAASGDAIVAGSRTNSETDFDIVESDLVLISLRARIGEATGLPPVAMELSKVLHYAVGQAFAPHHDYLDPDAPGLAAELQARGQRLVTLLLYLNDDYEGGETDFPRLGLHHRGRRGDALMFANVDLAARPDPQTLHAGLAPTRGEKWVLSQWIRDRAPAPRAAADPHPPGSDAVRA